MEEGFRNKCCLKRQYNQPSDLRIAATPAVPQGNLSMPTSVSLPVEASRIRSVAVPGLTSPLRALIVLRTSASFPVGSRLKAPCGVSA